MHSVRLELSLVYTLRCKIVGHKKGRLLGLLLLLEHLSTHLPELLLLLEHLSTHLPELEHVTLVLKGRLYCLLPTAQAQADATCAFDTNNYSKNHVL